LIAGAAQVLPRYSRAVAIAFLAMSIGDMFRANFEFGISSEYGIGGRRRTTLARSKAPSPTNFRSERAAKIKPSTLVGASMGASQSCMNRNHDRGKLSSSVRCVFER